MGCFQSRNERRCADSVNLNYVGLQFIGGEGQEIPAGEDYDCIMRQPVDQWLDE